MATVCAVIVVAALMPMKLVTCCGIDHAAAGTFPAAGQPHKGPQGFESGDRTGIAERHDVAVDQHHFDDVGAGLVDDELILAVLV